MSQRAIDTVNCLNVVYNNTINIEPLEPNENYQITKNIAKFAGGKITIPFFHIPPDDSNDFLEFMKSLFYLASRDLDFGPSDCLVLYVNICRGGFLNLDKEFRSSLVAAGMECLEYSEADTEEWITTWLPGIYEEPDYTSFDITGSAVRVCIGIYWNFITKRLTSANIEGWLKKRRGAYATACGIAEDDEILITLSPELGFADKVNQMMAACFPFKTMMFRAIRSLTQRTKHGLSGIARVTMVYFSTAELTGFAMIYDWILLRNPILLTWNGLAKHNASLLAAVNVFRNLGEDAPYCKFLYPPEQLQVFQHARLGIFVAVAFEVSLMEGKASFRNYQGVARNEISTELSAKVKEIVTLFGGARTKNVSLVRKDILADEAELGDLYTSLNTGLKKNDINQDGPSVPN